MRNSGFMGYWDEQTWIFKVGKIRHSPEVQQNQPQNQKELEDPICWIFLIEFEGQNSGSLIYFNSVLMKPIF